MATITIENAPQEIAKKFGTIIDYNNLNLTFISGVKDDKFKSKPRFDIEVEAFSKEEMDDLMKSDSIKNNVIKLEKLLSNI